MRERDKMVAKPFQLQTARLLEHESNIVFLAKSHWGSCCEEHMFNTIRAMQNMIKYFNRKKNVV